ncbi:hypothetical protein I7X12_05655 [Halosimplex litoreum]|uniref:PrgI family protein n=1 Tax=Halosimplex litoreum TaxID=1198301 RepID=A0A7T3KWN2_9EURY|nr:hypothetical protein [Halosimplex litoreum]QPV64110.1 hypothetical protein I7X12_05655 [Halosimplex litoreum]
MVETMKTARVPGKILRTTVMLGLTFDELVVLGSVPMVLVLPTLYIEEISFVWSLLLIGVAAVGVVVVAVRTPEGQTPVEWAPAAARRRLMPSVYYLKPAERNRGPVTYRDRIHTHEQIRQESPGDDVAYAETLVASEADDDRT